VFYPTVEHLD